MTKLFIFISLFLFVFTSAHGAEDDAIRGIATYLKIGSPEKASSTARALLKNTQLTNTERQTVLEYIVEAETTMARAKHYEDVKPAVAAIQTLINAFPNKVDEEQLTWEIANLYWDQDSYENAQAVLLDLQNRFPSHYESHLMMGKIFYLNKNYADARNSFLRYALHVNSNSEQAREVRLWTALVDFAEKRFVPAFAAMEEIIKQQPELITNQESIYSRYILLLAMQNQNKEALRQADAFLSIYKATKHAPEIRLLHADLTLELFPKKASTVEKSYEILSINEADTVVGRQAFMRKMMLQARDEKSYRTLKPVIIALKRIANQNQLSDIEDEAFLHEARLWEKVAKEDAANAPTIAPETALTQYTRVTASHDAKLKHLAQAEGNAAFIRQIQNLIHQESWLRAVSLWERFPNFRPAPATSAQLRFDMAHALRQIMAFDQAETLLEQLHAQADGSVWGEKVMLERARLWLNRNDSTGVFKILTWLDKHEFTLYRPEMLVIAAQMQLKDKNAIEAIHTLEFVMADDLSPESRIEYWRVQALAAEQLSRWHVAARSWRMYANEHVDDKEEAKLNEAHALFKGNDFVPAAKIYATTPEALQSPVWQYRYSVSQLKTARATEITDTAIARLETLKNNADAGIYPSLAALTLAERQAERLMEKAP